MPRLARLTLALSMLVALAFAAGCGGASASSLPARGPALARASGEKAGAELAFVGHGAGTRRIDASSE